jgi:uncharacterized protein YycO
MQPLLRFSRGEGILGALVRTVTWSDFAHVGVRLPGGHVLDATPQYGVSCREVVDDEHVCYFTVAGASSLTWERAIDFVWSQIDQPYDFTGALGVGLHRDWRKSGHWDCSETWTAAFEVAGFPLLRAEHLDRVTPATLLLSPYLRPVAGSSQHSVSGASLHPLPA